MLDAVLLILREVLEATLCISLLLALCRSLQRPLGWCAWAIAIGLCGSLLLGQAAGTIAEAFDGTGQELLNAALYLVAISCFVALAVLLVPVAAGRVPAAALARSHARVIPIACALVVACSLMREGSEVWIYLSGYRGDAELLASAVIGCVIGGGIGVSIGILVYFAFSAIAPRLFQQVFCVLASLIAGGLAMQFAKQLTQIGWLDSGMPIWDSGWLVDERSWSGQLLHALFGYDANPDVTQSSCYVAVITVVLAGVSLQLMRHRRIADA